MNWPIIKATTLALVVQFLVQFSGANAVSAYAVNMAETVGFTAEPYLPAVSITALRIAGSILSLLILRFHSFSHRPIGLLPLYCSSEYDNISRYVK